MPNGKYVINDLDFEKRISGMGDRDLLEFVARQDYETCFRCEKHDKRITSLENQSRKISGIAGGTAGLITAIIVGIINYFVRN